jgi:2-polyprenyl-3-methyl-5-hydroxy-6-metoxy-1,4-benzoquinol methylase
MQPEDMSLKLGAKKVHEGRRFMYEQAKVYHDSFIDERTNLFKPEHVEWRSCPVCNNKKFDNLFTVGGGIYVKCRECDMCYTNPVFTDEALRKFYEGNNTVQSEVVENESDFYYIIYKKGLDTVEKNFSSKGRLLDIGCSAGNFLNMARTSGWKTSGIELNQKEAVISAQRGHEVFQDFIENIDSRQKFDVITMWDVFEHIKNGHKTLSQIKSRLNPKGVLFMQIPNSHALAARIMQNRCKMFDGLEHVNLYNPPTIQRMAEMNGFKILNMETVISEIPIVENYVNYEDPYFGTREHNKKVLGLIDEKAIHEKLLGYKMQILLQPQ